MNAPLGTTLASVIESCQVDKPALVGDRGVITYGRLAQDARELATGLVRQRIRRFACVVDHRADLVSLLAASSAVGAEACVYPHGTDDAAAADLASVFDHGTFITDRLFDTGLATLTPDDLRTRDEADGWPRGSEASPVMILTTGTTGRPKGARHDWRRLVAVASRRTGAADARWLSAYNPNQFGAYQVLLHALCSGAAIVVPTSNQPRDALRSMLDHGVTHVSATPTFWRFLLGLLHEGDRLPNLRQITIGGERVDADLLGEVARRLPHARVSQIYGSTELGTGVSVNDRANGLPLSVLDRSADADIHMRIVDGELHIRSRIGMLGYYGEDEAGDGWRPTGDLVEVRGDRIHFVGRAAETINVGGVKVHPASIEERVGPVPGVRLAHARGRKNPVTGQIVQLDVVPEPGIDQSSLEHAIREACATLPAAAQPRRIRFVDELDVHEHKIRRSGVRRSEP